MATTSGTPTASTAILGQKGNGKGKKGRVAGLVAAAALGLGLLGGLVLGQARPTGQPADPPGVRVNPYWVYTEDVIINGNPAARGPLDWEQVERAQVAPGSAPTYVPDQFTYREDHRGPVLPCWVEEVSPGGTLYQGFQTTIPSLCQR